MWYEIIPSAAIITVALSVPMYGLYFLQKLVLGNGYRRNMDERFSRVMYQRDFRLTDNPYKMNGLDAVPDAEEEKEEAEAETIDPPAKGKKKK